MPALPEFAQRFFDKVPESWKATALLRTFSFWKVPMLFFTQPAVVSIDERRSEIRIPLTRRTKNHLNTMYFGALTVGAEASAGLLTVFLQNKRGLRGIDLQFKEFQGKFLRRAEGDVHFVCSDGKLIAEQLEQASRTGERVNVTVHSQAFVPSKDAQLPVGEFSLVLSLKKRS